LLLQNDYCSIQAVSDDIVHLTLTYRVVLKPLTPTVAVWVQ